MTKVLYLDANVFIHPTLYTGERADAARAILAAVAAGREPAVTCALTLDEVVWAIGKEAGREAGLRAARAILDLPNLRILPVREADVRLALDLLREKRRLAPRDAVHAACALNAGVFTVASDDSDFDAVPGLTRRPLA